MATITKTQMHPTKNDMPEAIRAKVSEQLNATLASVFDLYSQVKQAHWNVKGKDFYQLHKLFDEMGHEVLESVDEFAERITTLAGTARGTVRMSSEQSILKDYPADIFKGEDHIRTLSERYAMFGKHLRECIDKTAEWGDADTADLYTQTSRQVDMRLWFLEAHLQA